MRLGTRLSRIGTVVLAANAVACADLRDVVALASAIQTEYKVPANVSVNNASHLRITFQNAPLDRMKLDSAGRATFAREVATFAKAHYSKAGQLDDITIAFASVKQTGLLTVTRTDAPYSFRARDLP